MGAKLTFITVTEDIPEMSDACETISLAQHRIGIPDSVLIVDSREKFVRILHFRLYGDLFREVRGETGPLPLEGECVFLQSRTQNLIGDVFLRCSFKKNKPQVGQRFRLVRIEPGADIEVIDEKFRAS